MPWALKLIERAVPLPYPPRAQTPTWRARPAPRRRSRACRSAAAPGWTSSPAAAARAATRPRAACCRRPRSSCAPTCRLPLWAPRATSSRGSRARAAAGPSPARRSPTFSAPRAASSRRARARAGPRDPGALHCACRCVAVCSAPTLLRARSPLATGPRHGGPHLHDGRRRHVRRRRRGARGGARRRRQLLPRPVRLCDGARRGPAAGHARGRGRQLARAPARVQGRHRHRQGPGAAGRRPARGRWARDARARGAFAWAAARAVRGPVPRAQPCWFGVLCGKAHARSRHQHQLTLPPPRPTHSLHPAHPRRAAAAAGRPRERARAGARAPPPARVCEASGASAAFALRLGLHQARQQTMHAFLMDPPNPACPRPQVSPNFDPAAQEPLTLTAPVNAEFGTAHLRVRGARAARAFSGRAPSLHVQMPMHISEQRCRTPLPHRAAPAVGARAARRPPR